MYIYKESGWRGGGNVSVFKEGVRDRRPACLSKLVIADEAIALWVLPVVDVAALGENSCNQKKNVCYYKRCTAYAYYVCINIYTCKHMFYIYKMCRTKQIEHYSWQQTFMKTHCIYWHCAQKCIYYLSILFLRMVFFICAQQYLNIDMHIWIASV